MYYKLFRQTRPGGPLPGGSAARRLAFGFSLGGLAPTLFCLCMAQMLLVLFWRLLIGCAGFAQSNRDRLFAVLDPLPVCPRTKLAMFELVHDASDGLLLRLGFARRHLSSPFDVPRPY
jgi:hypothetical protein